MSVIDFEKYRKKATPEIDLSPREEEVLDRIITAAYQEFEESEAGTRDMLHEEIERQREVIERLRNLAQRNRDRGNFWSAFLGGALGWWLGGL